MAWAGEAGELARAGGPAGGGCVEGRIAAGITPGERGLAGRWNAALSLATTYPHGSLFQAKEAPDYLISKVSAIPLQFADVLEPRPVTCSFLAKSAVSSFPESSLSPSWVGKTN